MEINAYTFGPFRLEPRKRLLTRDGVPVPLTPKAFDLLVAVVERRERVVEKEEALRLLWPDTVVEEANLTQNVFLLRKALGDNQDDARFIATVPRRGYRFVAEVQEVAAHGDPATAGAEPASTWPAGRPARRWRALALAVSLPAGLGLAVWLGFLAGQRAAELPEPRFQRLSFRRGNVHAARFAPDGRSVVYSAAWDDQPARVFLARPENPESQPLDLPPAEVLAVSRRGDVALLLGAPRLAGHVTDVGTLARVPLEGGAPRELLENVAWADWGPDGESLAVVRVVGSAKKRLEYPVGRVLFETLPATCLGPVRVSPEGRHVAFLTCEADGQLAIAVVDTQGRRVAQARTPSWTSLLAWSRDGGEVWYSAASSDGLFPAVRGLTPSGRDRAVARLPGSVLDVAQDGRALVSIGHSRAGIAGQGPDALEERELSWLEGSIAQDLSADGRLLLFGERFAGGGPRGRIYLRATDGRTPAVFLGEGQPGGISADGRYVVVAGMKGRTGLTLLPTGPGEARDLDVGELRVYFARFFRDGRRLLIGAETPGRAGRLWVLSPEGAAPRAITPELTGIGVPSPDGRFVAAIGHDGSWIYPVDGGERRAVPGALPEEWPLAWSDDGWLYMARQDELPVTIWRVHLETGRREAWRALRPADPAGVNRLAPLVSRDGRSYAYTYVRELSDLYLVDGLR